MTVVLDSGGVTALATNNGRTARLRLRLGWPAVVPSVVLTEALTGDHRRDHPVNRFLATCRVVAVGEAEARLAARLRTATGRAGSISAADALVAAVAAGVPDPVVVTSDPHDLAALVAGADRTVVVLRV